MIKKCPKCRREYETTNTLCPVDGNVLERIGDPLEGQVLADKYRIEERISAGGMGAVYRATHVLMDKKVAVKVLHPALASDDAIVQRFTREARAASRISHPHALNVTDFGEAANGVVFLVMEYLGGRTLKEVLREEGPLPLGRTVEIFRQITGALDAAHAEGVVHRDLKSDNIMLEEVGGHHDWAKVLDFGIAKIQEPLGQDPALTAPNLVIGTPQYMSPEQCSQSSNIDKRSDIYSLGIILYEMLTGNVPFTGDSPTAIMMHQLQDEPPSVLELQTMLPANVDLIIKRALAKSPDERFDSAGDFSEALIQAAGEADASAAATIAHAAAADTNGLPTTTAANAGTQGTADFDDAGELTVVAAPATAPMTMPLPVQIQTSQFETRSEVEMPLNVEIPAGGSNPWRIMIPAALALLSVIGLVYAFSGNSTSNSTNPPAALSADPNSQPAQSATPAATGASERNLPARDAAAASAPAADGSQSQTGTSSSSSGTVSDPLPPTDDPQASPTTDANTNSAEDESDANTEANENAESTPSPTPAEGNRNTNQRRPPSLTPPSNTNTPPPPPPPANSPAPRETPDPSPRRRVGEGNTPQTPAPPALNDNDSPASAPVSFRF